MVPLLFTVIPRLAAETTSPDAWLWGLQVEKQQLQIKKLPAAALPAGVPTPGGRLGGVPRQAGRRAGLGQVEGPYASYREWGRKEGQKGKEDHTSTVGK